MKCDLPLHYPEPLPKFRTALLIPKKEEKHKRMNRDGQQKEEAPQERNSQHLPVHEKDQTKEEQEHWQWRRKSPAKDCNSGEVASQSDIAQFCQCHC